MSASTGVAVMGALAVCMACTTTLTTRPLSEEEKQKWQKEGGILVENGITYLEPRMVLVRYAFTQRTNDKGEVVGALGDPKNPCAKTYQKSEIQWIPDPARRMVIQQSSSAFASTKFSVTFNPNGTLNSINSEANPYSAQILGTVGTVAAAVVAAVPPAVKEPACNASPLIDSMVPIDDLKQAHLLPE